MPNMYYASPPEFGVNDQESTAKKKKKKGGEAEGGTDGGGENGGGEGGGGGVESRSDNLEGEGESNESKDGGERTGEEDGLSKETR